MQILTVVALIVIGILLFELIIFSHEFGHFITAKLSGVKVNEFALGMGPKIISFVKGETRYSLRLFPIGGYCAMEGEDEDSEEKGAFNNAKVWKRMIIIIAGAVMNILLGFVMMFAFTVQADSYSSTTISQFQPNAFTANTGLQTGDKIVEVNGYSIWNSRDLQFAISTLPYETVEGNTLEVYKERATSAACGVYNKYAKDESLSKDELQKYYDALSEGCSKINKAASKDEAKKLLDETCKSIYALDKSYDISKYKTPEIDTTTSRPRFMGDVKVVRDGKEITLENVQFFTYLLLHLTLQLNRLRKMSVLSSVKHSHRPVQWQKPCGHRWCGLFRADLHSTICQVLLVLLQLSLRLHQWDFKQASEMQSITFFL